MADVHYSFTLPSTQKVQRTEVPTKTPVQSNNYGKASPCNGTIIKDYLPTLRSIRENLRKEKRYNLRFTNITNLLVLYILITRSTTAISSIHCESYADKYRQSGSVFVSWRRCNNIKTWKWDLCKTNDNLETYNKFTLFIAHCSTPPCKYLHIMRSNKNTIILSSLAWSPF